MTVSALFWIELVKTGSHGEGAIVAELAGRGERLDFGIGEVEVPIRTVVGRLVDWGGGVAAGRVNLPFGHESGVDEVAQDVIGPSARRRQVDQRRILGRRFEQAGQHRRFREIDVARGFPEIGLGRRLDAEGARAHIHPIKIEFENLLFRQMVLEPQGKVGFLDLAFYRAFVGEEEVLRQLLRDR